MKSTSESIREAQQALAIYLEAERERKRRFDAQHVSGAHFVVEDDAQHSPDSAARRAAEYAEARNQNFRPLRQIDETDENAREGRDSALAYLERRRRSTIRK